MKYILVLFISLISLIASAEEYKLSWESKSKTNSEWSKIAIDSVNKNFRILDTAVDMIYFCPTYNDLTGKQKIIVWSELVSSIAYFESSWDPENELEEKSLGIDPVTGKTIKSQGLMQLSYGDSMRVKSCQFNWEQDNKNPQNTPSILQPKNNLECGITILTNQIKKHKMIVIQGGAYWSVIKKGHRFQKIDKIKERLQDQLKFCSAGVS